MGILEIMIAFIIGGGASLTAAAVYDRMKDYWSPSDTQLMMSTIRVASREAKKDPHAAKRMIAEMKASLLADAEYRQFDLNGEIDKLLSNEAADEQNVRALKRYYKQKKKAVDERRRRLALDVKTGKRPSDYQ